MKFPKSRANCYVVIRETMDMTGAFAFSAILGVFEHFEDAEDYRGACQQEWFEKVGSTNFVDFSIKLSTFYG